MALLFWLFARDAPGTVQPQPLGASFAAVSREPIAWHLSLFYFVTFGGFVFFANYLPQLLGDWFPLDRENAGLQAAIFTLAATFARPVGGWLADLFGGVKVLTWVFAFIVITRLLLAWQAGHANPVIVTDLLFAVAVGFGFGNGCRLQARCPVLPEEHGFGQRYRRLCGRSRWVFPTAGDGLRARSYWELRVGFRDPRDARGALLGAAARAKSAAVPLATSVRQEKSVLRGKEQRFRVQASERPGNQGS